MPLYQAPGHLLHLITDYVLPYCRATSSADQRSRRDAASQLSRPPPLALVAASPALRIFFEDEQPYRLGGAWWLSNYRCEEVVRGSRAKTAAGGEREEEEEEEGGSDDDVLVRCSAQHPQGQGRDRRRAPEETGERKAGDCEDVDNDGETEAEEEDHREYDSAYGESSSSSGGGGSGGGGRRGGRSTLTYVSGHMALLPRQLSSTRLFAYLEGIPTTWINFCSTAAQSCCADSLEVLGVPSCLAASGSDPPPSPPLGGDDGGDLGSVPAVPASTSMTVVMSQLYVMCNHPEARLAYSLWWLRRRPSAAKRYSRRREGLLQQFAHERQTRHTRHHRRNTAPTSPERLLYDVTDIQVLFLCADLTFFSTVDRVGVQPPRVLPPLPRAAMAKGATSAKGPSGEERGGDDDDNDAAAATPPLVSFVFLNGATTLALQRELHKERLDELVSGAPPLSPTPPTVKATDKGGMAVLSLPMPAASAAAMVSSEAADEKDVCMVPLLKECEGSSDDSEKGEEEECDAHRRLRLPYGSHFPRYRRAHHRGNSPGRGGTADGGRRIHHLVTQRLFHTTAALAAVHVHTEVSAALAKDSTAALAHLPRLSLSDPERAQRSTAIRSWDAAWLAELFPHARLLDLDGEGSGSVVAGTYSSGGGGGRRRRAAVALAAQGGGGRVTFHSDATVSPPASASNSPDLGAATRAPAHPAALAAPPPPPTTLRTILGLEKMTSLSRLFIRRCDFAQLPAELFAAAPRRRGGDPSAGSGSRHDSRSSGSGDSSSSSPDPPLLAVRAASPPEQWGGATSDGCGARGLRELCVAACHNMSEDWIAFSRTTSSSSSSGGQQQQCREASALRSSLRVLSLTDMDLEAAAALSRLSASLCPLSTASAMMAAVTHLDLSRTPTHSNNLRAAKLHSHTPMLRVLRLSATDVDDVSFLVKLRDLRILNLAGSQVDKQGLALVQLFPQLEELYLMNCPRMVSIATDEGADRDGLRHNGGGALPVRNALSLHEWSAVGRRLGAELGLSVQEAERVSLPCAAGDVAWGRGRGRKRGTAATALEVLRQRRSFPHLRVLDVSTNRLLTERTLFPLLVASAPVSFARRVPQEETTAAVRHRPPPGSSFPRLTRLLLMLTAVSQLGPLAVHCPRLKLLDASFTEVTSQGLWTHCELPGTVSAADVLSAAEGDDFSFPPPLQLDVLRLSGSAVHSLSPLRLRPPADSLRELLTQRYLPHRGPPHRCERDEAIPTDDLLSCADYSHGLFDYGKRRDQFRVDGGHRGGADHYYCHQVQFMRGSRGPGAQVDGGRGAAPAAARPEDEGQRERSERDEDAVWVRYGFADSLALRELVLTDASITGRGLGAAFAVARVPVARAGGSWADTAPPGPLSAAVSEGKLKVLSLRGSRHLLEHDRDRGAEEQEAGEGTGAVTGVDGWRRAEHVVPDGQLVSLAMSADRIAAAPGENPTDTDLVNRSLDPNVKGLIVALGANAPTLRVVDVAATSVSLDVFLRPTDPRARLINVFVPVFIDQESGEGPGGRRRGRWADTEALESGWDEEEGEPEAPESGDAAEEADRSEHAAAKEEEEEEAEGKDGDDDGDVRARDHHHHHHPHHLPEDGGRDVKREGRATERDERARRRLQRLRRLAARGLEDRRVRFWFHFLLRPNALVRPQVPLLRLSHLMVGGTAVDSFVEELVTHIREQCGKSIATALQAAMAVHELQQCLTTSGRPRVGHSAASLPFPRHWQLPDDAMDVVARCRSVPAIVARALAVLWGGQCLVE